MKGFRSFEGQQQDGEAAPLQMLACRVCNRIAPHSDLATYGARCGACFRAYCAEANPQEPTE